MGRFLVAVWLGCAILLATWIVPGCGQAHASEEARPREVVLWYFWRDNCPHCERASQWLQKFEAKQPALGVRKVEVVRSAEGRALFERMMDERGRHVTGVPTIIVDDQIWVGFTSAIAQEIEAAVTARLGGAASERAPPRRTIDLGPFGTVDLGAQTMLVATALIAFVDGFNPCSLWVLTVLLSMVLGTRSRARIAAIGVTFLAVTATIYGVFIVGLFSALFVVGHLGWIQVVVALLALGFGAVNVKDYFAFKQGLSFTIPDRYKPRIYRGTRALREDRPLGWVLMMTVALAAGISLVELPCTAGFPVVWTTLMADSAVTPRAFAGLLVLYLIIYLLDELLVLGVAVVTLRATRMQETHGRVLKLVSGMVMVALAVVLLVDPGLMNSLMGSMAVIATALGASLVVVLVDRRVRHRSET